MSGPTHIKPRTDEHWLYQPDDLDKIEELAAAVNEVVQQHRPRTSGRPEPDGSKRRLSEPVAEPDPGEESAPPVGLAEAQVHDKFVTAAKKRAVHVVLEQLGGKKFRDLKAQYPPRDGNDGDLRMGVNDDTFAVPLLMASLVKPEFTSESAKQEWVEDLRDADCDLLYSKAWLLNKAPGGPDPKASLASVLTQASAAQQK